MFRSFFSFVAPDNKLHAAADKGDLRSVQTLLDGGANVNLGTSDFFTALHFASQRGHYQIAKLLIEKGANLRSTTSEGFTPLHLALQQKKLKVSELLIEKGSDVNARDDQNWTPLHNVCFNGFSLDIVKALLERGSKINVIDKDGKTPLHLAAEFNHVDIVKCLIENNANINAVDKRKWTPLHCAAYDGSLEAATTLINKGSDVDARTERKTTPLHFAVDYGHLKVVKLLLEQKADVNALDHTQWTPLHFSAEKGHIEISKLLLQYGADANLKDDQKGTALILAVQHKHPELVNILLEYEPDVNAKIAKDATPLHLAAQAGSLEMVEALLSKGAYFDAKVCGGPLVFAADFAKLWGNSKIVQLMGLIKQLFAAVVIKDNNQIRACIKSGAVINASDSTGKSPLHHAISTDNFEAVKLFLQHDADVTQISDNGMTALLMAVAQGNGEIVDALVQYAVKTLTPIKLHRFINAKTTNDDTTALHNAAQKNNIEIVKLLLKNGATYNVKNKKKKEPYNLATNQEIKNKLLSVKNLFEAVKSGNANDTTEIIQKDKDIINARDMDAGVTPLYWAVYYDHPNIVKLLLDRGADPTFVTNKGNTPLHMASSKGNNQVAEILLEHLKSDNDKLSLFVNTQTTVSRASALHIASNADVAKSLLQHGAIYSIRNKEGKTPLDVAEGSVKNLLAQTKELFENAENGKIAIIDKVKELEPDLFAAVTCARNERGQTLLQISVASGLKYITKELSDLMKKTD